MQGSSRRRSITRNAGVASGSVWETRMKMDQVKGGIKVFNGDNGNDNRDEEGMKVYQRLVRNQSDPSSMGNRKRRNWKQPEKHESGGGCNAIQLKRSISELNKEEDSVSVEEEEEKEVEIDKEMDLVVVVVNEAKSEAEEKVDQSFETPASTPTPAPEKIEHETIDLRTMHPDPVKPPSLVSNANIHETFEAEEEEVDYQCETKLGDHNRMQSIGMFFKI